jgi:glucose-6-phosphate isomerase
VSDPALTVEARIPASLKGTVVDKLSLAGRARVAERLRLGDATLWGGKGAAEISDRLGWLTIAERMLPELRELGAFAEEVRDDGLRDAVLLGMGGSSLAAEVLRRSAAPQVEHLRLHVLDSTDAATVRAVSERVDPEPTLFLVSSKSGGTIEPLSLFAHFLPFAGDGSRFIAITDPGTGLERLAAEHGFRGVFGGDPEIGGRYSALSAFGIVPAALMGVDVRALLERAAAAWQTPLAAGPAAGAEPMAAAIWLGVALSALARAGRDKLTFAIAGSLPGLGLWLEQLFAESTGKQGTGILPVAEEPLLEPDAYGEDRVFAYLPDTGAPAEPDTEARLQELAAAGHPVIRIPTRGPLDLGRVFLLAEVAVAAAGWGLGINPFDQPNVQQAKDATNRVLAEYEGSGRLAPPPEADAGQLRALVFEAGPPQYVALMAYLQPSAQLDGAAADLRETIMRRTDATTTFGYGPRFLHSTGQFHKGGPPVGRFLQLLHDTPPDVEIPGRPYTFGTLKEAQALGDLHTLRELGRPAERVRLQGADAAGALRELTAKLKESP